MVIASTVILAAGFAFGVGRVIGLGHWVVLTAIPAPSTAKNAFIKDDDGKVLTTYQPAAGAAKSASRSRSTRRSRSPHG
jgi:hypothetical protein